MTELREQHVTKELFQSWQQGSLNSQKEQEFLEHVGRCTYCAEQFAEWMEEDVCMEPPVYLKEEIKRCTRQLDVQTVVRVKQTSKRIQLLVYSLKVGLAVAASIFLLVITGNVQSMGIEVPFAQKKQTEDFGEKESISDKLRNGSSMITETLEKMYDNIFQITIKDAEKQEELR